MPTPAKWSYVLTDLSGNVLGELAGAKDRTLTLQHNRIPTASFTIPLWHPRAANILTGDALLKVYRNPGGLVFVGPILSIEETGNSEGQSIACTATGPFWRLTKRIIGDTKAGWALGSASNLMDLGEIAFSVLATANARGYTGIDRGTHSASTSGAYGPVWLKNAAEAITELSAGINSFDFEVVPVEPTATAHPWPRIGSLNIANTIGVQRPDAVFEYGTQRANVSGYQRQMTNEPLLNNAIVSVSGWPDGSGTSDLRKRSDATSVAARGLYEEVVNDAGVIDDGLRDMIADQHLRYRASARQIVTFTPASNARPTPFVDYRVGDWVRARAAVRGIVRFDAMFRIWGASFKLDQNGNESLDLQLVQE